MPKTPEQKLLELEIKIKLLEKQNAFLAHQVEQADKQAMIFDMMIDLAEKEYNIPIRKNSSPEQSTNIDQKKRNANSYLCVVRVKQTGLLSQNKGYQQKEILGQGSN